MTHTHTHIYIYIYIYLHIHLYIYIYLHITRIAHQFLIFHVKIGTSGIWDSGLHLLQLVVIDHRQWCPWAALFYRGTNTYAMYCTGQRANMSAKAKIT